MSSRYKVVCCCECCISPKSIHSSLLWRRDQYWKISKIKSKILKPEGLVKKQITYMKHIKVQSCLMGIIFVPKHMIWKRQKCVHIHSQIINYHTGNVYFDVVLNFRVLIFLTKKHIISITIQPLQLVFTFII